jgi:hypothetical protein
VFMSSAGVAQPGVVVLRRELTASTACTRPPHATASLHFELLAHQATHVAQCTGIATVRE